MRHNTLIRKRTDALTRRDDRWNWKSRNFGNQRQGAAAFRETWSATSWKWLTTLFVCMFRLSPPFIWGTLLSFFWIATVQQGGRITGSFHGRCNDSEQGEVKMCLWMKTVVVDHYNMVKQTKPERGVNPIPGLHSRKSRYRKKEPRFSVYFPRILTPGNLY